MGLKLRKFQNIKIEKLANIKIENLKMGGGMWDEPIQTL